MDLALQGGREVAAILLEEAVRAAVAALSRHAQPARRRTCGHPGTNVDRPLFVPGLPHNLPRRAAGPPARRVDLQELR